MIWKAGTWLTDAAIASLGLVVGVQSLPYSAHLNTPAVPEEALRVQPEVVRAGCYRQSGLESLVGVTSISMAAKDRVIS